MTDKPREKERCLCVCGISHHHHSSAPSALGKRCSACSGSHAPFTSPGISVITTATKLEYTTGWWFYHMYEDQQRNTSTHRKQKKKETHLSPQEPLLHSPRGSLWIVPSRLGRAGGVNNAAYGGQTRLRGGGSGESVADVIADGYIAPDNHHL